MKSTLAATKQDLALNNMITKMIAVFLLTLITFVLAGSLTIDQVIANEVPANEIPANAIASNGVAVSEAVSDEEVILSEAAENTSTGEKKSTGEKTSENINVSTSSNSKWGINKEQLIIKELQNILQASTSFQASYQQIISDPGGKELRNVEGELFVKSPDQFRQTSKPPFQELIICNGEKIWIYDEELEQVTVKTVDKKLQQNTPLLLLARDSDNFVDLYDVSGNQLASDHWLFELMPKNKERLFEKLQIAFKGKMITEMYIIDSLGQKTHLSFSDVKNNIELDDKLFSFTPPEGVDVINE